MRLPIPTVVIAALVLGGCATVPKPLAGDHFATLTPRQAATQDIHGETVRWGGKIVKVVPESEQTCFEVLSRELYANARPRERDASGGRFIACSKGFYDPELYAPGRELTVTGRLAGTEQHKVGDYNYTYAHVDADTVYLWPKREPMERYNAWPSDPFWGPFGPYWGGGFWVPPVVIIRPAPTKP